jgi:predicted polyphosphate/ATP-dependent NAD kinase
MPSQAEKTRKTIGLIINPVAGMGGSVGLKGTDGDARDKALALGATPISPGRTLEVLRHIQCHDRIRWLAAAGPMGADTASAAGLGFDRVGEIGANTSSADTQRVVREMLAAGAQLVVFAGGDGTARDLVDALGTQVPVVAIPSGVKVYSAVFAYSPRAAAALVDAFVSGADCTEEEVLDIDEEAYRHGRVESLHYGFLLVPEVQRLLQGSKESSGMAGGIAEAKQELATIVVEGMLPGTLYLLGCGTTVRAVAEKLGLEKSLLGIDAVVDGRLVGRDLNERGILQLLDQYPETRIVLTPLGGNGFLFGRGNKQFTPQIIRRVGRDKLIVIANREKMLALRSLHVDTGDPDLDRQLAGYIDVVVGLNHSKIMRIA